MTARARQAADRPRPARAVSRLLIGAVVLATCAVPVQLATASVTPPPTAPGDQSQPTPTPTTTAPSPGPTPAPTPTPTDPSPTTTPAEPPPTSASPTSAPPPPEPTAEPTQAPPPTQAPSSPPPPAAPPQQPSPQQPSPQRPPQGAPAPPGADDPLSDPRRLSAAERSAQQLESERLAAELGLEGQAVADARALLADLAAQAGAALEANRAAQQAHDAAELALQGQQQRLQEARDLVADHEVELGRWAAGVYRDGGAMAGYETLVTLFESENTDDFGQRLVMLERVGQLRSTVVTTAEEAEVVQLTAAARAAVSRVEADRAQTRADQLQREADQLVADQQAQLDVVSTLLAQARVEGDEAMRQAAARAVAEQRRLAATNDGAGNRVTGRVGSCAGGNVGAYPNGSIPVSALCEVTDGQYLRADAAFTLGALSAAYEQEWGVPLCVTDAYRTLDSQVGLYATKPHLAAVPGTSNHGWGTAVDLCGGIQTFGTGPHRWMRENAPLFGWFHPSWAQAGGSRPEAWHWEYGG